MDDDRALSVPVSHRRVRSTYERTAGLYDRTVARIEASSQRRVLARVDISPGDTVLDLGCGPGTHLPALARQAGPRGTVIGVDPASSMLARAQRRAHESGHDRRIRLLRADGRRLPLGDDTVDVVCAFDVLDLFSWTDLGAVLDACRRVLVHDGRLCVVTMDRASLSDSRFLRLYELVYRHVPGFAAVGCRPIPARRVLREAGFEIESVTRLRRAFAWPVAGFVCTPE